MLKTQTLWVVALATTYGLQNQSGFLGL